MKKNKNIIYSTENVRNNNEFTTRSVNIIVSPEEQTLYLHLKKLPGNKISTIIKGFIGNEIDLIELSKILKKSCGVGGTVKDDIILLQGNQRNKIKEILFKRGFKVKISGG